jgi:hypothetical protein
VLNCDDKVRLAETRLACADFTTSSVRTKRRPRERDEAREGRVESIEHRDGTEGATRVEEDDVDVDVRLD